MEEQKKQIESSEHKEETESLTFFNVMPKIKNSSLVMPNITSSTKPEPKAPDISAQKAPGEPAANAVKKSFFARFKLYIILFIILAVLGAAGYFIVPKYFLNEYKTEDFVVSQPKKQTQGESGFTKDAWLVKYFNKIDCDPAICGNPADPDRDGLVNEQEYTLKTDPNNADSDKDSLADGDEINVFGTDPLADHSGVNKNYTDTEYAKNAYDPKTDKKLTSEEIKNLNEKMRQFGLHQPTLTALTEALSKIYLFDSNAPSASSTASSTLVTTATTTQTGLPKDIEMTPEAKQDRDTQRSLTIKTVGIALIKYFDDNKSYPAGNEFKPMYDSIKPYIKTALNPNDPINLDKYVYSYAANASKTDFTLSYYSETLNQLIKKTAKDAKNDKLNLEAAASDDQRRTDLDSLRSALLVYSADNIAGSQEYVFPSKEKYKTALVPKYMTNIPKDPKTSADYEYQASETFDTFTLKAIYDAPPSGKTGYMCNQEECRDY